MNHHHQIFTLCFFVFTKYQIVQGWYFNSIHGDIASANMHQSPPGYHYETIPEIVQNYDPNTYSIVPLDQALSMYTYGTTTSGTGGKGHSNTGTHHKGGVNTRKKRGYLPSFDLPYFTNNNTPTSTSTTITNANSAEDVSTKNVNGVSVNTDKTENTVVAKTTAIDGSKNQGHIANTETEGWHIFGIGGGKISGVPTETTKTSEITESTVVKKSTGIDTADTENQGYIANAEKGAIRFLGFGENIKNYVSSDAKAVIKDTTAGITNTAAATKNTIDTVSGKIQGVIANTESEVSTAISIGEDIEHGLVIIGPYLPLLYKVAVYVVPSMTPYQTLQLSWEVANIMTEAMKNYEEGESLGRVSTVAAAKVAYDVYLGKRDTGAIITEDTTATAGPATITEYATNIYERLKNMFNGNIGTNPLSILSGMYPSLDNNNIVYNENGEIAHLVGPDRQHNGNNFETIGKSVVTKTVDGDEILHSSDNKIQLREPSWKLKKTRELESQVPQFHNSNCGKPSHDDDDDDDDDDDENEKAGKVVRSVKINKNDLGRVGHINKTQFDELLNNSMKYQPSFIQNTDGKVLVEKLNTKKSTIPASVNVDISARFAALTSTMKFAEDVTENQINELVNVLSKTTEYFILKAIRDKQSASRIKS